MTWDDFDFRRTGLFPTVEGNSPGKGTQRVMIASAGGSDGIRTKIRKNIDGTVTMLRTRNGFPEFSTTAPETIIALEYEEQSYSLRAYGGNSFAYVFWVINTPLLKSKLLTFNAFPYNQSTGNPQFYDIEPELYSSDGLASMLFVRHVKTATITIESVDHVASFAYLPSPTYFSTDHTVIGYSNFCHRASPIKTVAMNILAEDKTLYFKQPPNEITTNGLCQFDKIVVWGNPWHGVFSDAGFTLSNGVLYPYGTNEYFNKPTLPYLTCYLNFGLPDPPAATPAETAAGMEWKNDSVLCGLARTQVGVGLGFQSNAWIYRAPDGSIHTINIYFYVGGATGILLYVYENFPVIGTHYYISGLECPDYYAQFVAANPTRPSIDTGGEFPNGPGAFDLNLVRQSPDGKKCCATNGSLRTAVELSATGGEAHSLVTITSAFVDQLASTWVHSLVGSPIINPPLLNSYADNLVTTGFEYWSYGRYPVALGYTKTNQLYIETFRVDVHEKAVFTPAPLPFLYNVKWDYWRETEFSSTLGHSYVDSNSLTGYEYNMLRELVVNNGLRVMNGSNPDNWPLKSPTYDGDYAGGGPSVVVNPGTAVGNQTFHVFPRRVSDVLTVIYRQVFQPDGPLRYDVMDAYAYGETVPALIGHSYLGALPCETALNPRTGEVAFGPNSGFC